MKGWAVGLLMATCFFSGATIALSVATVMGSKDAATTSQLVMKIRSLETDKAGCFRALEAAVKHMNEEGKEK